MSASVVDAVPAAPQVECPVDRPDATAAAVAAKLCGGRVLATSLTSEVSQTWVNPDGTWTTEQYLAPVRLKRDDAWVPVDISLERQPDGAIASKVHPAGLRLAGGAADAGEHELVALGEGDLRTAVAWAGELPAPSLSGATATYANVLPSVDLVVEATRTGYKLLWVVRDAAGLASVASIPMSLLSTGLTARSDGEGGVVYTDRNGTVRGTSPAPSMWDSTVDPRALVHTNRGRVDLALTSVESGRTGAVLTPDPDFLARKDLKFPLYIDPPSSLTAGFDAFVQTGYGSDWSGDTELRLGTYNGGADVARSFVQFNTASLAGSTILSAQLKLWAKHSWTCTPRTWVAYRTSAVSSSVRWSNQPAPIAYVGQSDATRGYSSSCAAGWVSIDVDGALQHAASTSASTATVLLAAANESDNLGWKKFNSLEAGSNAPYVTITYDPWPTSPTDLAVAPCNTLCGSPGRVSSLRPTLSAELWDANPAQELKADFYVYIADTSTLVAASGLVAWANGGWSWQLPSDLVNGNEYEWRVRGHDGIQDGSWSDWQRFTVDTTKPGVPFVSSTLYANDGQPHGGAGVPGTFSLTPAGGTTDLAGIVYTLSSPTATLIPETTVATTTGLPAQEITPSVDGNLTLVVRAKDTAGNLSDPNVYQFKVGAAALSQPLAGASVARRMKIAVDSAIPEYTRAYLEYRRGPGGSVLDVPSANLRSAAGAPITATATTPVNLASAGGHVVWNAADTLGLVGGVVEVRAQMFTDGSSTPVFATPWVRVSVDVDADGAAGTSVGPGSVNLLTGDYTVSSTDTDDLGLSVGRVASSRRPADGMLRQQERLDANQRQVGTDTTGFTGGNINCTTLARVTSLGQGESTDSLELTPYSGSTCGGYTDESFATVGGDDGGLRLSMTGGNSYRLSAWIYVPSSTGLVPSHQHGLRLVGYYKLGSTYYDVVSPKASYTDAWQELTLDLVVPAGATEAFFRLYNGMPFGSGKTVYYDNLSMTEVIAPFGPSWTGGATGGPAAAEFTTLTFPQPPVAPAAIGPVAQVNLAAGGAITFSLNADLTSWTPQPGAEGLTLAKPDANTFRVTDIDGSIADFTLQGGTWALSSTRTTATATTTTYIYDTTSSRALLTKVINPVEPGVDDTNACTQTPQPGCEILEYVYATATTSGLSQTVFGDYEDTVKQVKLWASDPTTGAVSATVVTEYRYDVDGELREVWDPRVSPALKTTYDYGPGGRVTTITPAGELPWQLHYANPDVDSAALRWDLDETAGTNAPDTSGNSRNGSTTNTSWVRGPSRDPVDRAASFNGTDSVITRTAGSGVATNTSFTVSAWVNLADGAGHHTAVAQDGTVVSGFFLEESGGYWALSRPASDVWDTPIRAWSSAPAEYGTWTHLTGVYDGTAGQIKLYVNGVLNETTACACAWNATGPFVVGRVKWNSAYGDWWRGDIDDVRIYNKVLTAEQIADLAGDKSPGKLIKVERAALQQGSPTVQDGTIATNLVYNVPLTTTSGGPHTLDAATAATWSQTDLPTDATALFGPEDNPGRNSATPTSPGTAGYPYATIHYLNANGREVNTATPGGHIDTAEYDKFGNTIRTLQATDREIALGTHPQAGSILADLGLTSLTTAARAQALSSTSTYSTDGLDLLETLGPTMTVVLEAGLTDPDGGGPLPAISAGATVKARAHTVNVYDQNKPDGATYHLLTTTTSGAAVPGYPDADARTTTNAYNAAQGGTSGWVLRQPTTIVADAGPGGAALASHIVYDGAGRATKSWGIGSNGSDVRTATTIFYTAGTNSADAGCGNTPKWAGQPCVTKKAGPVTGHDPARMAGNLPERRVTAYTRWGDVGVVTETVPGTSASRTTTTGYDTAGRVISVAITSTNDGAVQLPAVTTSYSTITGQVVTTQAGASTITREYDNLGRLYRYTDADGGQTTNEFDRYGKPSKVSDPTGWATFAYNRTAEPRGYLTSITDSIAGTLSASYSPDGQLTTLIYPNGMTRTDTLDANLEPVARTYKRNSDSSVIYQDSVVTNTHGQAVSHTYTGGSRTYGYDRLGRLTSVADTADGSGCTTRTYTYDSRTNRDVRTSYLPDGLGACQTTTSDTITDHTVDTADRLVDADYVYDSFGRITSLPGGLTNSYHANDLVASQTLGTDRQNWTLDPTHRLRAFTTETFVSGNWVNATSKLNHYGDDSDEVRWIIEDTTLGSLTRMVSGPDGDLAATTSATGDAAYQVVNLHGDVVTTLDATLIPPSFNRFDEFGLPISGQQDQRYGWLGGKQRSAEALGDVILMGVRLYHPDTGRFLQTDPVDGGSATAYDYCNADPVNCLDLDGRWPSLPKWANKALNVVAKVAEVATFIPGPIGTIAGVVSAGAYAATGNWKAAAWAAAGAVAALVGAGAAVKIAKVAVNSTKVTKAAAPATKSARALTPAPNRVHHFRPPARGSGSTFNKRANAYIGPTDGYHITYRTTGGGRDTWKWGISSDDTAGRIRAGVNNCRAAGLPGCSGRKVITFTNRFAGRMWEWANCTRYVYNRGRTPQGMPRCR